jgi:hypothetical protein
MVRKDEEKEALKAEVARLEDAFKEVSIENDSLTLGAGFSRCSPSRCHAPRMGKLEVPNCGRWG